MAHGGAVEGQEAPRLSGSGCWGKSRSRRVRESWERAEIGCSKGPAESRLPFEPRAQQHFGRQEPRLYNPSNPARTLSS